MKRWIIGIALAAVASAPAFAQKEVTIAYQDMVVPYRIAQEAKELEKATGYKINWKQFGGGGEVIKAMASGAVQVGEIGSAGISAAVSRGEPLEVFWILDDIGSAEALVAKNGSGINSVKDLKGKTVAVPFNSTTHFHLMVALQQAGVNPADVKILNLRPPEVRAAWQRGDIQATFIWNPVLDEVKKDGKVILTSGKISADTGKATFDGFVVNKEWAKANKDFLVKFVKILAASDDKYRKNHAKWTAGSDEAKAVAKWSGAKPEDVPAGIALYAFPTAQEQSAKWLGGGKNSVAAKALAATAEFQLSQKQIEKTLPDYSVAVDPTYVQNALK
ncbi:MAG: taurine ABC transporter substrate-binding protein [Burkholderiales bacterium]|jgi:taurine transport system substrate-binding protein|nr:taurine ABC transporter substrate-binding protein [Burkholderiales bacterium]